MQLLRLPSNRSYIFLQNMDEKLPTLSILPFISEDFSFNSIYTACNNYKSVEFYRNKDLETYARNQQSKLSPFLKQDFLKKIEGIDLYVNMNKQEVFCLISDKFGDMHRLNIDKTNNASDHNSQYLNSNLGIPKYNKYCWANEKQYFILGDEEKRIKIYNAQNPHQILSMWHLINMHSVELLFFGDKILLLMKYFDQISLKEDVQLHWFSKQKLEEIEYPGKRIQIKSSFDKNKCKFYTMAKLDQNTAILVLLTEKTILYQLFVSSQQNGFISTGAPSQIEIDEGKWDFLDLISISNSKPQQILISYGQQVQIHAEIVDKKIQLVQNLHRVSLNAHQKLVRINL